MKQRGVARRLFLIGAAPRFASASFIVTLLLGGAFYVMQTDALGAQWSALLLEKQSVQRELPHWLPAWRRAEAVA